MTTPKTRPSLPRETSRSRAILHALAAQINKQIKQLGPNNKRKMKHGRTAIRLPVAGWNAWDGRAERGTHRGRELDQIEPLLVSDVFAELDVSYHSSW